MRLNIIALLLLLLHVCCLLVLTAGTVLSGPSGLILTQSIEITPHSDTDIGIDAAQGKDPAALEKNINKLKQKMEVQQEKVKAQQQTLDDLATHHREMRAALASLDDLIDAQRRLLTKQKETIAAQKEMIDLLHTLQQGITPRMSSVSSSLASISVRLSSSESTLEPTLRLRADHLRNDTEKHKETQREQKVNIDQRITPTAEEHASDLNRLSWVDDDLIGESTQLTANATILGERASAATTKAISLRARVADGEDAGRTLTDRTSSVESVASHRQAASRAQAESITEEQNTADIQQQLIESITGKQISMQSDIVPLQSTSVVIDSSILDQVNVASLLRRRVISLEGMTPDTSPMVDYVSALWRRTNDQVKAVEKIEAALTQANATLVNRLTKAESDELALANRVASIETRASELQIETYTNVSKLLHDIDFVQDMIINFKTPQMYRYVYTATGTWTVPAGVSSAFATLAGGGGGGYGWRFASYYATGPSGGYLFSQPISFVSGESVTVTIGAGALSMALSSVGVAWGPSSWWTQPATGNGIVGLPGNATFITSPSMGELVRCGGGSGMAPPGLDTWDTGEWVPGTVAGGPIRAAGYGSERETIAVEYTGRAAGAYTRDNGPGACGPNDLGLGNMGTESKIGGSGDWPGGSTPFGYGNGGLISRSGCAVSNSGTTGLCTFAYAGRDGIAYLDGQHMHMHATQ